MTDDDLTPDEYEIVWRDEAMRKRDRKRQTEAEDGWVNLLEGEEDERE